MVRALDSTHDPPPVPHHGGASTAAPTKHRARALCLRAIVMVTLPFVPSLATLGPLWQPGQPRVDSRCWCPSQ